MNEPIRPPDHDELRDLCAAHALGALDPEESARLEAHLATGCEECAGEVEEHRRVVGSLGSLLEERTPPARAEERLMTRLAEERSGGAVPAPGRPSPAASSWLQRLSLAAAILIALPALWIAVESRREVARLERTLQAFETTTDPIVTIIDLEPTPAAAGARARVTYDPRSATWRLFAHDLVSPPAATAFQGWLETPEGLRSFGLFLPDESGHGFLVAELPGGPSEVRITVTLEPAGGSARPTGTLVFGFGRPAGEAAPD